MSWRTTLTVLTVLTALTLVARFSNSRAYPDRPCSRAPLSAEGYFDAQHAKERLRATQTASEGAGMLWPVRALFRDIVTGQTGGGAQKVRGRSHPTAAFRGGVSMRGRLPAGS